MLSWLLMSSLVLQSGDARLNLLNGPPRSGQVTRLDDSAVTLMEGGRTVEVPVADVLSVEFPAIAESQPDLQLLVLRDGSQLVARDVSRSAQQVTAQSAWLGAVEIPADQVRAVRLQADNPALAAGWQEFLRRKTEKDLLVVAKRDGSGLDFLAGVVSSVSAEQILFLLDGDTVPVPAARVYGIVFGQPADSDLSSAATARLVSGDNVVAVRDVTLEDGKVTGLAGWGQRLEVPVERVSSIDLSGTRIRYLSELAPLEERFEGIDSENSLLSGLITEEQQQALFGPRRDITLEQQSKLRLRGQEYSRGLCLHSRTRITWELGGGYASLQAVVGIDDEVAFNGKHAVLLKVSGDDRVLLEQLVSTTDPPRPLAIPLDGVSTLEILVDFGDGDSVCDWLDLADARLIVAKEPQ